MNTNLDNCTSVAPKGMFKAIPNKEERASQFLKCLGTGAGSEQAEYDRDTQEDEE